MAALIQSIVHLVLKLFGRIENHTKPPELDGGAPDDVVLKSPPADSMDSAGLEDSILVPKWLDIPEVNQELSDPAPESAHTWSVVEDILERPFVKPEGYDLAFVPTHKRYESGGVYSAYGKAPKEEDNEKNKEYPKAQLKVHSGLVGTWNGAKASKEEGEGNARLYMEKSAGEHLREALLRAAEMERRISVLTGAFHAVLSYVTKMGSFSHRHIRHNPANELSFHSWAIACDLNPPWNRGVTYAKEWQKRVNGKWVACEAYQAQQGPVDTVLPFSKQYGELYPKALPVELVMAFKSVNFCWGGDWGRSKWHKVVAKFGYGYDQNDTTVASSSVFKEAMKEWKSMRYCDPMHFELTLRGDWAMAHYERTKA